MLIADNAPQALPNRKHSGSGCFIRYAERNPASKESPAPVVSRALTLNPESLKSSLSRIAIAPLAPRLTTTHETFAPSVFNAACAVFDLVSLIASRSLTNNTSVYFRTALILLFHLSLGSEFGSKDVVNPSALACWNISPNRGCNP